MLVNKYNSNILFITLSSSNMPVDNKWLVKGCSNRQFIEQAKLFTPRRSQDTIFSKLLYFNVYGHLNCLESVNLLQVQFLTHLLLFVQCSFL